MSCARQLLRTNRVSRSKLVTQAASDLGISLRIHAIMPHSYANGPGTRAVIWTQGCTLACPGCFNAATHPVHQGSEMKVNELYAQIAALAKVIDGVTITGGEPVQQLRALMRLLALIRIHTSLSVILFTGYSWRELKRMPSTAELFRYIDVLIEDRYLQSQRIARGVRGSANKTIHFLSQRYGPDDFTQLPDAEVCVTEAGEILLSGIEPLQWSTPK